MGGAVSKAASDVGDLLGGFFTDALKSLFGVSCKNICQGRWDVFCFIDHLCFSDMVKLFVLFGFSYITLIFVYLVYKLGICQCTGKNLCKMCWSPFKAFFFLWKKIINVKRVHRRRHFQDIEVDHSSTDDNRSFSIVRNKKLMSERRKNRHGHHHHYHHLHSGNVTGYHHSGNVTGRSQELRDLRRIHSRNANLRREVAFSERRLRRHSPEFSRLKTREEDARVTSTGMSQELSDLRRHHMRKASNLQREATLSKRRLR